MLASMLLNNIFRSIIVFEIRPGTSINANIRALSKSLASPTRFMTRHGWMSWKIRGGLFLQKTKVELQEGSTA